MSVALVTGANGFTGHYLVPLLAGDGHAVHGVGRIAGDDWAPELTGRHLCDIADQKQVCELLEAVQPDFIVHLAAISFVGHEDISEMYRTNVLGTRFLLEAARRLPKKPEAVLIASSANIYGNGREGVLDEDSPFDPVNDYAVSKVAAEYVARLYRDKLPIIVARPFNYTGVGQSPSFLIPKIVDHVRRRAPVIEMGNLDIARDFTDVRVLVSAYHRLLASEGAVGGTFNICRGDAIPLRKIVEMAMAIGEWPMEIRVNPAFVRTKDVGVLVGDSGRLEGLIGPLNHPPIEETLRWMIQA